MNFDARRFRFELEPLLQQRRWELEKLQVRLASAHVRLRLAREERDELAEVWRHQAQQTADALARRVDPRTHVSRLHWLAQLKAKLLAQEKRFVELKADALALAKLCVQQQGKVDVVEAVRTEALAECALEADRQTATENDRDWMARLAQRAVRVRPTAGIRLEGQA